MFDDEQMYERTEEYIAKLEKDLKEAKSQLADIKYLNADEVEHIIGSININQEKVQAICNLAIDIDRDKIIEVLRKYFGEYNFGYLDGVTDQIIKAIRGEE